MPAPHPAPRYDWRVRWSVIALLILIGAVMGQAGLWMTGRRSVGQEQARLLTAVYRIDPHPEQWLDTDLEQRLSAHKEVVELFEAVARSPITKDRYPYIAVINGHPSPFIDPGESAALLMLVRAIDAFPKEIRPALVQAIVSTGAALANYDLQAALQELTRIEPTVLHKLIGNEAAGLKHLFGSESGFQDAVAQRDHLLVQLPAERAAVDADIKSLNSAVEIMKNRQSSLANLDRRCTAIFSQYRNCLENAAASNR